jgi:hypothetical protein
MRPSKARNGNVAAQATRRQLDHENHACQKNFLRTPTRLADGLGAKEFPVQSG